jgi:dimeric dUTPase (all-alpha-NTP-PPase superfamily)
MDLHVLAEIQSRFDNKLIQEKNIKTDGLIRYKLLALCTELGEMANEWRFFKYWSLDRNTRYKELLQEFSDGLHFLLSLWNEKIVFHHGECKLSSDCLFPNRNIEVPTSKEEILDLYNNLYRLTGLLIDSLYYRQFTKGSDAFWIFTELVESYIVLGKAFGFTEAEMVQAYMDKNKTNHERQLVGY